MKSYSVTMLWIWIWVGCATVVTSISIEEQFKEAILNGQRMLRQSASKISIVAGAKDRYSRDEEGTDSSEDPWYATDLCEDKVDTTRQLYDMMKIDFTSERRKLSSSASKTSMVAEAKDRYSRDEVLSEGTDSSVCVYSPPEEQERRTLRASASKVSIVAQMKDRYSESELQSKLYPEVTSDVCVCEDTAMKKYHQNLVEGISNGQRTLSSSASKASIVAQMKDRYSESDMPGSIRESHQLVACSISKAHSIISEYYETCGIDRCCELEQNINDYIYQALTYTRYCGLYSDNLNEDGTISVSSDFPGPYLEPGLPTAMSEYGVKLQAAIEHCQSCKAAQPDEKKASLLTDLEDALMQWNVVAETCAQTAVPAIQGVSPPTPLSVEKLASREIKVAQNALFVESTVRIFEENADLKNCPAFYDFVFSLSKVGVQMLTYAEHYSDMCDASAKGEDVSKMKIPQMPNAQGLRNVDQLVEKRNTLCPDDEITGTNVNMVNLFHQVQVYQGLEMASLQSNFKKIHSTCDAVGINGGQKAPVGAYSHTVNLRSSVEGQSFCGGILFSKTHVLTAAHCIGDKVKFVSVGSRYSNGSPDKDNSQIIAVKKTVTHKDFDLALKKNDIMIVELVEEIDQSKNVVIAQLGNVPKEFEELGMSVKMTGWGSDAPALKYSDEMKEHALNLETIAVCDAMLNETIDESFVCTAGNFGSAVCYGDSGGPLQLVNDQDVNAVPIVIGVVNFGVPCGVGRPDAFARISYYRDWIDGVVNDLQGSSRKLLSANTISWTNPSLETYLENDISNLHEAKSIKCRNDHPDHLGYRYVHGKRYAYITEEIALSWDAEYTQAPTIGCDFIPRVTAPLQKHYTGKTGQVIQCSKNGHVDFEGGVYVDGQLYFNLNVEDYYAEKGNVDITDCGPYIKIKVPGHPLDPKFKLDLIKEKFNGLSLNDNFKCRGKSGPGFRLTMGGFNHDMNFVSKIKYLNNNVAKSWDPNYEHWPEIDCSILLLDTSRYPMEIKMEEPQCIECHFRTQKGKAFAYFTGAVAGGKIHLLGEQICEKSDYDECYFTPWANIKWDAFHNAMKNQGLDQHSKCGHGSGRPPLKKQCELYPIVKPDCSSSPHLDKFSKTDPYSKTFNCGKFNIQDSKESISYFEKRWTMPLRNIAPDTLKIKAMSSNKVKRTLVNGQAIMCNNHPWSTKVYRYENGFRRWYPSHNTIVEDDKRWDFPEHEYENTLLLSVACGNIPEGPPMLRENELFYCSDASKAEGNKMYRYQNGKRHWDQVNKWIRKSFVPLLVKCSDIPKGVDFTTASQLKKLNEGHLPIIQRTVFNCEGEKDTAFMYVHSSRHELPMKYWTGLTVPCEDIPPASWSPCPKQALRYILHMKGDRYLWNRFQTHVLDTPFVSHCSEPSKSRFIFLTDSLFQCKDKQTNQLWTTIGHSRYSLPITTNPSGLKIDCDTIDEGKALLQPGICNWEDKVFIYRMVRYEESEAFKNLKSSMNEACPDLGLTRLE